MSNVKNAKNLNNIDNAVMHKLDSEDREKIDSILVQLDVIDNFNQIITDYADYQEFDKGKDLSENILLTYYEIRRNKQSILTLLYETKNKLDAIKSDLQELMEK